MTVVQKILDLFEEYLDKKGVVIDNPERDEDDNAAQIYGTEYGNLEDKITKILEEEKCIIITNFPAFKAKLKVEYDFVEMTSESLSEYIEKYSME